MKQLVLFAVTAFSAVLTIAGCKQSENDIRPFELSWVEGKCISCETATHLDHIQFTTNVDAWAIGYGPPQPNAEGTGDYIVVRTNDAGHTWSEMRQTHSHAVSPAFSFSDAHGGWISLWNPADDPKMISTQDGGDHWQHVSSRVAQNLLFFNQTNGYGTYGVMFLKTADGGKTWSEMQIPHVQQINRLFFLSPKVGWLAGSNGNDLWVFRTMDGGLTWDESRTTARSVDGVQDLFFLDPMRGWLLSRPNNMGGSRLFATIDGGKVWAAETDTFFQDEGNLATVVRFLSSGIGFVFESEQRSSDSSRWQNTLLYTTDGGVHWRRQALDYAVNDCQVFEASLQCSADDRLSRIGILTVHPK